MKPKEILTIVVLGLGLGLILTWSASRFRQQSQQPAIFAVNYHEAEDYIDPRWKDLNPSLFDQIHFIFEKEFHFEGDSVFRPIDARPAGRTLVPGERLSVEIPTRVGTLGLLVESRASTPGVEISHFRSPVHQEGVNLKQEMDYSKTAQLVLYWGGNEIRRFPLETYYWRPYYTRLDGDGNIHRLELAVEIPEGAPELEAAVKKVSLFMQDTGVAGKYPQIGIAEAGLRAEAMRRKIILLGLDGITWKIVDPMMAQGKLPNLQRLIEKGVRATLVDEPPLDSPKIWTTIATGRHPSAHGIDRRVYTSKESADPIPVNSTLRRTKALWNQFGDLGRTVGFLGWFVTWPAEAVNGFMVTDRGRFAVSHTVYPEILGRSRSRFLATEQDLANDDSAYARGIRRLRELKASGDYPVRNLVEKEEFKMLLQRLEEVYFNDLFFLNYGLYLYEQYRPDLFAPYFHGTDAISHAFYKFRFPEENFDGMPEQLELIGDPIEAIYEFHDRSLGQLMEMADPRTVWVILSDHGFQAQDVGLETIYIYDLDSILEALGLLQYQEGRDIRWKETVCYTSRQLDWNPVAFVRMNLAGREAQGIVAERDFESERERVIEAIQSVRFADSGKPVFSVERVDAATRVQDLRVRPVFEPEDFSDRIVIQGQSVAPSDIFAVVPLSGNHNIEGVLVLSGEGVRRGVELPGYVRTVDIAPTVLALAGLPIGNDLDGRVVEEALTPEFLLHAPVRSIPSYEELGLSRQMPLADIPGDVPLEVDQELVREMKKLGYLGN